MGLTSSVVKFPEPNGAYKVGAADLMTCDIQVDQCGAECFDKYDGIFVRLFYPCDQVSPMPTLVG